MSSPGFKRWGATSGASSPSTYNYSRSDGTQYVSPSESGKVSSPKLKPSKPSKPAKPAKAEKSSPKPGKAAVSSSPSSSVKPAPKPVESSTPVVKTGLNKTTYEKQPDWAYSERNKNSAGQYRDGMFQDSSNPNNIPKVSSSPKVGSKATTSSSSPGWAQKPVQATFSKPATTSSSSSSPKIASYQVGGYGNSSSTFGSNAGTNSSGVVKSGLPTTTYEKQPDWAYAERNKNAQGQYQQQMFQKGTTNVTYGGTSAAPSQLKQGGYLR